MKSNLQIDYSNNCKEYSDFIGGKPKKIKTPWEKKRHKKFKKENPIKLDFGTSSDDSRNDCVIIESPKKRVIKNQKNNK